MRRNMADSGYWATQITHKILAESYRLNGFRKMSFVKAKEDIKSVDVDLIYLFKNCAEKILKCYKGLMRYNSLTQRDKMLKLKVARNFLKLPKNGQCSFY